MKVLTLLCVALQLNQAFGYVSPGPDTIATKGEIWPKPYKQTTSDTFWIVQPDSLKFEVVGKSCDILDQAINRYKEITKRLLTYDGRSTSGANSNNDEEFLITINLKKTCEDKPHSNMNESYKLTVSNAKASIESESIWGILHGLESFSQLLYVAENEKSLRINATEIDDKPRYAFRGIMVDTSRHFISVTSLKTIIDGMACNKLNVFHWHMVDDQSFPYESKTFPELSKGAYHEHLTYSQADVNGIVEYARIRGIRSIAEFDTPGHTRSWGVSHPEILTACGGDHAGQLGPFDPTKNETYEFMQKLLAEIVEVFPDEYVHLGGDEIDFTCWDSNQHIQDYMKAKNIDRYQKLEELYIHQIADMVNSLGRKSIVWQDVFNDGVSLAPGTIVHVWTGDVPAVIDRITKNGLQAVLSACWYLHVLDTGGDWQKFYNCEPSNFPGNEKQQELLIGGAACMWDEVVDDTNIIQRIFPRASAAAERLWSPKTVDDLGDAVTRLEEHTCRMKKRGIAAQPPNGPGFCY